MKAGLIGLGYWGPNIARVLQRSTHVDFAAACDMDETKLHRIGRDFPSVRCYSRVDDLLTSDVDIVLIATTIGTHYELAVQSLLHGKHTFVEKPVCDSSDKASDLVALAERMQLTLMTGHTFVYSPAVVKVKELIRTGSVGDIRYISSSRLNLGLYQKDVDVVWDLAVHDISILLFWLGESPIKAMCFGRQCVQANKNDVAFLWFQFPSGVIASCDVSWLSPQKMRRTCVVGSKRMVVYDDTDPNEKVRLYDRGVAIDTPRTFGEFQLTYRMGDILTPHLPSSEPLLLEIEHFVDCCETRKEPTTSGRFGLQVVRAIEMARSSEWPHSATAHEVATELRRVGAM